ncbi:hypothetical protein F5887DRAFT_1155349 [Amanita rubescens]|nr:hypothetical protein F5887DRAFT_1155349 [Amanita rubescens]
MDYAVPLSCRAASATLVVYDWLITLDREPRRWSPAKTLFLFNRYFGPLCLVYVAGERLLPWLSKKKTVLLFADNTDEHIPLLSAVIVLAKLPTREQVHITHFRPDTVSSPRLVYCHRCVDMVVAINAKRIRNILIGGYILGVCTTVVILVIISIVASKVSRTANCYFHRIPSYSAIFWLPALIYKFVFIALATRISIKHARFVRWLGRDHIVTWAGFIKYSIFYFTLTSVIVSVNATVWLTLSPQWYRIFEGFSIAALCAAGNRLIFELVELYYAPPDDAQQDIEIPLQVVSARYTAAGTYEQVVHDLNSNPSITEHT